MTKYKFDWQKGYEAFTHSRSQLDTVVKYILNQEKHHHKKTLQEEYIEMLEKMELITKKNMFLIFWRMGIGGNNITVRCT